jgi:hypothetical protein
VGPGETGFDKTAFSIARAWIKRTVLMPTEFIVSKKIPHKSRR